VTYSLSEPNALLLDQAAWRLDGGDWKPREEILRLDDAVRDALGLPRRGGRMAQPWLEKEDRTKLATLELRFPLECDVPVSKGFLAVEEPESLRLSIDGTGHPVEDAGWWVDEAIRTVPLPDLAPGSHELCLSIDYHRKSNVEWCYLLGEFGVEVAGRNARIVSLPERLEFDDLTRQGLPFYSGNVTCHYELETDTPGTLKLRIPHFSGAVVGVSLDGEAKPDIAFAPYESDLGAAAAGRHRLDITLYGNRHNAFGPLHWAVPQAWVGPQAWRSTGDAWCYEYRLRPLGITSAPHLHLTAAAGGRGD
jgi:hypothetical protein